MFNEKIAKKEYTIKLQGWQVAVLLGAARMGILSEDWCASLAQTSIGTFDTKSGRWIMAVGETIRNVKKQTGVEEENKGYGNWAEDFIAEIDQMVEAACQENERKFDEWMKELEKREGRSRCNRHKGFVVPITKEMREEAKQFSEDVHKEMSIRPPQENNGK